MLPTLLLLVSACAPPPASDDEALQAGTAYRVEMRGDSIASVDVFHLPEGGKCTNPSDATPARAAPLTLPDEASPDTTVLVTLTEQQRLPRFPEPDLHARRQDPANQRALRAARAQVQALQRKLTNRFRQILPDARATVLDTFWLVDALQVRLPSTALPDLERHPAVRLVEAPFRVPPPPDSATIRTLILPGYIYQDTMPTPKGVPVSRARDSLQSDTYYDAGFTGGWVAQLDQGVNANHFQLSAPSPFGTLGDCVRGGADCLTPNPYFSPYEACALDHGTQTAAVLTANHNQGERYRGVTWVTLSPFRVFRCRVVNGQVYYPDLDYAATLRGFQAAVAGLSKVIVAPLAGAAYRCANPGCTRWDYDPVRHGLLIRAANRAFDAGVTVVAATGNTPFLVGQPAIAHRVLGIGSYTVTTGRQEASQGHRRTPDGRLKPDVQAPTGVLTAGSFSLAKLRLFAGTSGATAFAGGAAALLRRWLQRTSSREAIPPGQVYAQMILAGQATYPFNDSTGAGQLRLPPLDGTAWWGAVTLCPGDTLAIPLDLGPTASGRLDAALWWPERETQPHRNLDLYLLDPANQPRGASTDTSSVFERARVVGTLRGTWTLRIAGGTRTDGPRTVFWAAQARTARPSE